MSVVRRAAVPLPFGIASLHFILLAAYLTDGRAAPTTTTDLLESRKDHLGEAPGVVQGESQEA